MAKTKYKNEDKITREYIDKLNASIEESEEGEKRDDLILLRDNALSVLDAQDKGSITLDDGTSIEDAFVKMNEIAGKLSKSDLMKSNEASDIINPILNLSRGFIDSQEGKRQIRESKSELKALKNKKPSSPSGYKRSELLRQQINEAKKNLSPQRADLLTQSLRQDINDQYISDVNSARVASGGQAGAYSSLGQLAANRRLRNAMALQDAKRSIRNDADLRLDALSNAQIGENEAKARYDMYQYNTDLNQYNTEAEAAGKALSSGRINQRTGQNEIYQGLSDAINPTYMQYLNSPMIQSLLRRRDRNNGPNFDVNSNSIKEVPTYDFNNERSIFDYENDLDLNRSKLF